MLCSLRVGLWLEKFYDHVITADSCDTDNQAFHLAFQLFGPVCIVLQQAFITIGQGVCLETMLSCPCKVFTVACLVTVTCHN